MQGNMRALFGTASGGTTQTHSHEITSVIPRIDRVRL